jgi:hypothetical protein
LLLLGHKLLRLVREAQLRDIGLLDSAVQKLESGCSKIIIIIFVEIILKKISCQYLPELFSPTPVETG